MPAVETIETNTINKIKDTLPNSISWEQKCGQSLLTAGKVTEFRRVRHPESIDKLGS